MCCTETSTFGTYVELIIALIALIVSIVSIVYTIRSEHKHNQLSFFTEYTRRYQEIMLHIYSVKENDKSPYIRLYFDLCSEEFYLHNNGHLPDDIWNMWMEGMRLIVNNQDFITEWKRASQSYDDVFCIFFDREIFKHTQK